MALNLSPRPYNIDPTGRDYVLDPAPLLRAKEKNFQTQKETMKMVYETGRKGMEFAEYLGARQQLGRVKAQLSELDPSDPEFHRRLSSIIADNPLALENPNTAPGLKMALAPLTEEAGRAAKHRYEMEELTATYEGKDRLEAARIQGRNESWLYKQNHAPRTAAQELGLDTPPEQNDLTATPASAAPAPSLADKIPVSPASKAARVAVSDFTGGEYFVPPSEEVGSAPGVDGPNADLFPSGPTGESVPSPLPPITDDPVPPGMKRGNDGALYERKSVGKNPTWVKVPESPGKPTTPLPDDQRWVPEIYPGTDIVKNWKATAAPKLSAQSQTQLKDYVKRMGEEDPGMVALSKEVDGAKADFELATTRLRQAEKAGDAATISVATNTVDATRQTLLDLQRQQVTKGVEFHNEALRVLDPKFARAAAQFGAAAGGADGILETPTPITWPPVTAIPARPTPTPVAPATVPGIRDQLRQMLR